MAKYNDLQLLELIKADELKKREEAFEHIYRSYYEGVEAYIIQNKGSKEEAKDLFQDGLIVLYNQILSGAFREQSTIKTYLYGICRNIWFKKLKKKKPLVPEEEMQGMAEGSPGLDQILIGNEREQLIEKLLGQLAEECNQILKFFYFDKLSMRKIKELLQLASEQVAKNKKMRCIKKLRTLALNNPEYVELLKHYI